MRYVAASGRRPRRRITPPEASHQSQFIKRNIYKEEGLSMRLLSRTKQSEREGYILDVVVASHDIVALKDSSKWAQLLIGIAEVNLNGSIGRAELLHDLDLERWVFRGSSKGQVKASNLFDCRRGVNIGKRVHKPIRNRHIELMANLVLILKHKIPCPFPKGRCQGYVPTIALIREELLKIQRDSSAEGYLGGTCKEVDLHRV